MEGKRKLSVAICHPDLGIGGAERLIVDAALELKNNGHDVRVFTAHHDPRRCFEETVNGKDESFAFFSKVAPRISFLFFQGSFPVTVYGDFLPRNVWNKLHAICAYIRCVFVAVCMVLFWPKFDVVLVDQVSAVIPILKIKRSKIVFYCHFPDLLLAPHTTTIKKLYRKPIDWLEETTTGMADRILVNSNFTASTFARTFRKLHARGLRPSVLYPAVDVEQFASLPEKANVDGLPAETPFFLSINRFERKKNVSLAVSAFDIVLSQIENTQVKLVLAGGFDRRVTENCEVLDDLQDLARKLGISERVLFLPSCSTQTRDELLGSCVCVIYTPSDEHFGIVPLEAMAAGKPVIACRSGGPMESVLHAKTGFLCDPKPAAFASAMLEFVRDPNLAKSMGSSARSHVRDRFSRQTFGSRLVQELLC
ncbi:alpha-1,3/1,6-mannosyltransferase ALG2-like isoform X1 [Selaginella moellendorffii]|uniref:alpha-1,3/1,6-mannosyltransferase ALG2-like isoform X1 n=1 Tax=Selaginella moellendorffii TaxID=88036 RepID=UPI000D1C2D67|nr:alpha-1,3/1,6-mannosyltransferase ALG2-like isoform X1 [Selaginella moellendorffii]|eukprot:XP_024522119.1 alpha-1,3/1,6-mannosyltransferase ALG2-like isoform X1 [Selaginella moellendorffii]